MMIRFATRLKNGNKTPRTEYVNRLSAVLSNNEGASDGTDTMDAPNGAEAPPPIICELPAAGAEVEGLGESLEAHARLSPNAVQLEQTTARVAETLTEVVAQAAGILRGKTDDERAKLDAISKAVAQVSEDLHQVRTELADLRSRFATSDERLFCEEAVSQRAMARADELLAVQESHSRQIQACTEVASGLEARILSQDERFSTLDASLQAQTEAAGRLSSLCSKLEQSHQLLAQRSDSHEQAIQVLQDEVQQRGGLLERVLGSLRNLNMRREPRFPVERAVRVTVPGEKEAAVAGHVVDASDTGLGLIVETPVPVGSEVKLDVDGTLLSGKVAHCRLQGDKYAAGLSSVRQLEVPASGNAPQPNPAQP